MPLLDDVYDFLQAYGIPAAGWSLWKGDLPDDQPDQAIAIFETGGWPFDTMQRENEHPTFMHRVRGRKDAPYNTTRAVWLQVFNLLQDAQQIGTSPVLLPGYTFIMCQHTGPATFKDPKGRWNFITNWNVTKRREM